MWCSLLEHGYRLHHMRDEYVRSMPGSLWADVQLPEFDEIVAENLKADLDDAKKLQARTLG